MSSWTPSKGSPQGAVISPILSNIYLNPLDHLMAGKGYEMVRYADDAVILCRTEAEARAALETLKSWTDHAGLRLHSEKTKIINLSSGKGFDFLGYHFEMSKKSHSKINRWPRKKAQESFRDRIRSLTKRTNGTSMQSIIARINPNIRGWFEYFKHSKPSTFPAVDGWIRMRLRSILRKRQKGQGRGRGQDNRKWPNAYFSSLGFFSMVEAREMYLQPSLR
jgi:RNA-directed DNA polymerase